MVYDPEMSVLISSQVILPDGRPSEEGYKNPLLFLPDPPPFFFLFYLSISQFCFDPIVLLPPGWASHPHIVYILIPVHLLRHHRLPSHHSICSQWPPLSVTNPQLSLSMFPPRFLPRLACTLSVGWRVLHQMSPTPARLAVAGHPEASVTTPEVSLATMSPALARRTPESTSSMFWVTACKTPLTLCHWTEDWQSRRKREWSFMFLF